MTPTEKKLNELRAILSNNNSLKISNAVKLLRNEPPLTGAIGLLVSYYDGAASESARQIIKQFMNDLKYMSSRSEVMAEIRKTYSPGTIEMLVSSCWQSGLDYSEFWSDFTGLFLEANYMTALECFTVIESSMHNLTRESKDHIIKIINDNSPAIAEEKKALARELISLMG